MASTALLYRYDKTGPLLQQSVQCPRNIHQVARHSLSPSANSLKPKEVPMSYAADNRTLSKRTQYAIERRLFPHTNLTRKQLQHALGISTGTMNNLLSGNHDPSGRVLDKLVAFFREGFVNEVWGGNNIHCICTRAPEKAAAVALVITATAELQRYAR
jgi:hypothetical protein